MLALAVCLALCLSPFTAFAGPAYKVTDGGDEAVSGTFRNVVQGIVAADGEVSFAVPVVTLDATKGTITIKNDAYDPIIGNADGPATVITGSGTFAAPA